MTGDSLCRVSAGRRPVASSSRRQREALGPRRHVRDLPAGRPRQRVRQPRPGRSATSPRSPPTASTPSARTPCHRAGCWTSPHATRVARAWSAFPGSSTSPFSTSRARRDCHRASGSGPAFARAPAIPRSSATRSVTRSRRRSSAGTAAAAWSDSSSRLCDAAKSEDPDGPGHVRELPDHGVPRAAVPRLRHASTCTSSRRTGLTAYLARLQNLAGDRPLIMARDRARQPPARRSRAGARRWTGRCGPRSPPACAGAFVFAWTDEWHRGGYDIEDWDFGLDPTASGGPSRPWPPCGRRCSKVPVPEGPARARASRSSCAPTTGRAPSATAWRACGVSTTRTSR